MAGSVEAAIVGRIVRGDAAASRLAARDEKDR
jgi:hypothetical protein